VFWQEISEHEETPVLKLLKQTLRRAFSEDALGAMKLQDDF
jgi:hypothetical protein